MPISAHTNFGYSTLASPPSSTDGVSLTVASGHGALFPVAPFNAVIWPADAAPVSTNAEIVRVTAKASDTFTITRAQEGTSARTHLAGAQIAAGVTKRVLTDIEYGAHKIFNVEDPAYGAVGDGATDDSAAILAALNAAITQGGGTVLFGPGKTYYVGAYGVSTEIFTLTDMANVTIDGMGSTILTNTTASVQNYVFSFRDIDNVVIQNIRFQDSGTDLSVEWRGATGIYVQPSLALSTGSCGGLTVRNCFAEDMVALLVIGGDSNRRIRGVSVQDCTVKDSYYGINFRENGDMVTVRGFRCENVRRAYFPYGVTDHDVEVSVYHNGTALGSNAAIPIKRYVRDTHGIRVRATFTGDVGEYGSGVNLEHTPTSGTGTISGVDAEVNLVNLEATGLNTFYPFRFRSYDSGGVLETTATSVWKGIRLAGDMTGRTASSAQIIDIASIPGTEVDVTLSPSLGRLLGYNYWRSGFAFRLTPSHWMRFKNGDLTAAAMSIPLDTFDSNPFTIRVRVWAIGNYTSLAAQNATYQEALIIGYNAGGGAVTLQSTTVGDSVSQGVAATLSYGASGENLTVTVVGADYAVANSRMRVDLEYLSMLAF